MRIILKFTFIDDTMRGSKEELFIACNFSQQTVQIDDHDLAERLKNHKALLISNYEQNNKSNWLEFRPYEAWALQMS